MRPRPITLVRLGAALVAFSRLARVGRTRPAVRAAAAAPGRSISVVVPARNEAARIGELMGTVRATKELTR